MPLGVSDVSGISEVSGVSQNPETSETPETPGTKTVHWIILMLRPTSPSVASRRNWGGGITLPLPTPMDIPYTIRALYHHATARSRPSIL